jgi:hypothetical protein
VRSWARWTADTAVDRGMGITRRGGGCIEGGICGEESSKINTQPTSHDFTISQSQRVRQCMVNQVYLNASYYVATTATSFHSDPHASSDDPCPSQRQTPRQQSPRRPEGSWYRTITPGSNCVDSEYTLHYGCSSACVTQGGQTFTLGHLYAIGCSAIMWSGTDYQGSSRKIPFSGVQ